MFANKGRLASGNFMLLILVSVTVFVVPVFPIAYHKLLFNLLYTAIFFIAVFSLQKHRKMMLGLAVAATVAEWLSASIQMTALNTASRLLNILFFMVVVFFLIVQITLTQKVTARVIMEAINGYLLLGMVFALAVAVIMNFRPEAYNFPTPASRLDQSIYYFSDYLYYAFATFATVGYGDIVPLAPYAKSLAILTGVTGQIYVAVIIAMLVGKFAAASAVSDDSTKRF